MSTTKPYVCAKADWLHALRISRCKSCSVAIAWCLAGTSLLSSVDASPITLRFEATVEGAVSGAVGTVPGGLSFGAAPGDVVVGSFTFNPLDVDSSVMTTSVEVFQSFTIVIDSKRLTASKYGISVYNDVPLIDDSPLRTDTISLGSAFFVSDTTPGGTVPPIEWSFLIGLIGKSSILNGADIPQDSITWDQFDYQRSLIISFPPDVSGAYGFGATVTSFSLVPEPTAAFTALTLVMSIACAFRSNRRGWRRLSAGGSQCLVDTVHSRMSVRRSRAR